MTTEVTLYRAKDFTLHPTAKAAEMHTCFREVERLLTLRGKEEDWDHFMGRVGRDIKHLLFVAFDEGKNHRVGA